MAEYILLIHMCSLMMDDCSKPQEHHLQFADYYSCALTGYAEGQQILREQGSDVINTLQLTIGHECIKIEK